VQLVPVSKHVQGPLVAVRPRNPARSAADAPLGLRQPMQAIILELPVPVGQAGAGPCIIAGGAVESPVVGVSFGEERRAPRDQNRASASSFAL
jgi:hypothetical protein